MALLLLVALCCGCRSDDARVRPVPALAIEEAPTIQLRDIGEQPVAVSESRPATGIVSLASAAGTDRRSQNYALEFEFDDLRPEVERRYYPGSTRPMQWRDAVSMLPIESFVPPVAEQIRVTLSQTAFDAKPPLKSVRIQLTSFQFVFDHRAVAEGAFHAEYANWKADRETEDYRRDRRLEEQEQRSAEEPLRAEETVADRMAGRAIKWLFFEMPAAEIRGHERSRQRVTSPQTTPQAITDGLAAGLNCRIRATVVTESAGRATSEKDVDAQQHAPDNAIEPMQAQAARLVEKTIAEFCRQIVESDYQGGSLIPPN